MQTQNSDGTTTQDQMRAGLHGAWASVAGAWGAHADYADTRAAAVTARLLERTDPRPGDRVLELACGAGGVGIAAAERVGRDGAVVLSDVAEAMTVIAAERAAARGLENITTRRLDLEDIDEPDGSYDVVVCREGLMFALDPARAVSEINRVLGPGGRAAAAVWGPRDRNPWLGVVFDAVTAQMGVPIPPPGIPGPFALADAGHLAELFSDAGFGDVAVAECAAPMPASSFEEWWMRTAALAGPLANVLAALPDEAAQALEARARDASRAYETPDGLEFPGVTLIAFGQRD